MNYSILHAFKETPRTSIGAEYKKIKKIKIKIKYKMKLQNIKIYIETKMTFEFVLNKKF